MKIYICNSSSLEDKELFEYYYNLVSEKRKYKVDRLRFGKDKNMSLAAGVLLKYGLNLFGIDDDVYYDDLGKPHVAEDKIYFSLSHSENRVMATFYDHPIGCDVQAVGEYNERIAKRMFSNDEYNKIIPLDDNGRVDYFYRIWTARESLSKAVGCGMANLHSCNIDLERDPLFVEYDESVFWLNEYDVDPGCKYTVCYFGVDQVAEKPFLLDLKTYLI